jgi:hypothetical protein
MKTARAGAAPSQDVKLKDLKCTVLDMPGTVIDLLPGAPRATGTSAPTRNMKQLILHEAPSCSIRIRNSCLRQVKTQDTSGEFSRNRTEP